MTLLTTPIFDFHRVILKRSYDSAYDFDSDSVPSENQPSSSPRGNLRLEKPLALPPLRPSLGVRGKEILEGEGERERKFFHFSLLPSGIREGLIEVSA